MNLDIHSAVVMTVIVFVLGAGLSVWMAIRSIRKGRSVVYYRIRRKLVSSGLWTIAFSASLVLCAAIVGIFAEPVAYNFFPPSPTNTFTPTITLTPTISLTPTITQTPTITPSPALSYTPTITGTPFLPDAIEAQFVGTVTPNPTTVFSRLQFSLTVSKYQPVNPQTTFANPIQSIYVTYSYDGLLNGVQWTMLWYRGEELLKYDTSPWSGGTGGYGQYELVLPTEDWLPGTYQVIFFVGTDWKTVGEFQVTGQPPTSTPTRSPTISPTPSLTPTMTHTPRPTSTSHPTDTRWPSPTPVK